MKKKKSDFFKIGDNKLKLLTNIFWSISGKLVQIFSTMIVGIFVARYLGPKDYGLMNYVISYVSLFTIISSFGLDNLEIRELSKRDANVNKLVGTAFFLKLTFAIITIIIIFITTFFFESEISNKILIWIYSLSLIFASFTSIRNYFTAILQNKIIVRAEMIRSILSAIIKLILLYLKVDLIWFVGMLSFDVLLIAGGYTYTYRYYVNSLKLWEFDKKIAKHFINNAIPIVFSGIAIVIYQRIDQIMIKNMLSVELLGFYAVAMSFVTLLQFLPEVIAQTMTPMLVKSKEANLTNYLAKRQKFVDIIVWSSIILSVVFSAVSYWLIILTYGKNYFEAVPLLQILAFKSILTALSSSSGYLIIVENLQKWAVFRDLMGAIVCIAANYILIKNFGITGAAIASLLTGLSAGFISNFIIPQYKHLGLIQLKSVLFGFKTFLFKTN